MHTVCKRKNKAIFTGQYNIEKSQKIYKKTIRTNICV